MKALSIVALACILSGCPTTSPSPTPVVPGTDVVPILEAVVSTGAYYACPRLTPVGDPTAIKVLTDLDAAFKLNPASALTMLEGLGKSSGIAAIAGLWSTINTALNTLNTTAAWYAAYAPVAQAATEGCLRGLTP